MRLSLRFAVGGLIMIAGTGFTKGTAGTFWKVSGCGKGGESDSDELRWWMVGVDTFFDFEFCELEVVVEGAHEVRLAWVDWVREDAFAELLLRRFIARSTHHHHRRRLP